MQYTYVSYETVAYSIPTSHQSINTYLDHNIHYTSKIKLLTGRR